MPALSLQMRRIAQRHTSIPTFAGGDLWPKSAARPAATPEHETLEHVVPQLVQALIILRGAIEHALDGLATRPPAPVLQRWLPPAARQIEAAMQRLRPLALAKTPQGIDLTQALTVVVLAADMLAQDQSSVASDPGIYALLRRNADRALDHLRAVLPQMIAHI